MVYLQTAVSRGGPSAACFAAADQGAVELWVSRAILLEVGDVLHRPSFRARFPRLTDEQAYEMLMQIWAVAHRRDDPRPVMPLPRDPKDEPYVDLAVSVGADYVVTWDEGHLGYLMRRDTPEGVYFCSNYPYLEIVDPVVFLRELRVWQNARPAIQPLPPPRPPPVT